MGRQGNRWVAVSVWACALVLWAGGARLGLASDSQVADAPTDAAITDVHLLETPGSDGDRLLMAMTFHHRPPRSTRPSAALDYRFRLRRGGSNDEFSVTCEYDAFADQVACRTINGVAVSTTVPFGTFADRGRKEPMRVFAGRVDDPDFERFVSDGDPEVFWGGLKTLEFYEVLVVAVELDVSTVFGGQGSDYVGVADTLTRTDRE